MPCATNPKLVSSIVPKAWEQTTWKSIILHTFPDLRSLNRQPGGLQPKPNVCGQASNQPNAAGIGPISTGLLTRRSNLRTPARRGTKPPVSSTLMQTVLQPDGGMLLMAHCTSMITSPTKLAWKNDVETWCRWALQPANPFHPFAMLYCYTSITPSASLSDHWADPPARCRAGLLSWKAPQNTNNCHIPGQHKYWKKNHVSMDYYGYYDSEQNRSLSKSLLSSLRSSRSWR